MRLSDSEAKEQIGEGIHAGLRKVGQSSAANGAWLAINNMPNDEWDAILEWVVDGLASQSIYLVKEEDDACAR
jgi:hypothetical protein